MLVLEEHINMAKLSAPSSRNFTLHCLVLVGSRKQIQVGFHNSTKIN